ncbi:MAG: DUF3883 domain-containing protein [Desulfurococcales archaeon]|nr:DUF3883 domain-containing protein [Desulfurococcales archaeon]
MPQEQSKHSTASTSQEALRLLGGVLRGFELHPFFFILDLGARADPPVLPFAHQAELVFRLAFRRPDRVLVGDEIGLGKTVEAILAVKQLEMRGGARRVLLLVPRILVEQWRSELKRFNISATVLERDRLRTLARRGFPEGWYIASIDLVKRDEHRSAVTGVSWDVVIVDEAHRVGRTGSGRGSITQRYRLVEELARPPGRSVILLSATPHRGHAIDYISRLKLVDPYLVGERELDSDYFYMLTRNAIVVRRTKMDVNEVYEKREIFRRARFVARIIQATREEAEFSELLFDLLHGILLKYYDYVGEEPRAVPLTLALVAKRASSSPYAAILTLERMLRRRALVVRGEASTLEEAAKLDSEAESLAEAVLGVGFEDYTLDEEPDSIINGFAERFGALLDRSARERIEHLIGLARRMSDSRLLGVQKLVEEHLGRGDRIVLFTEYKDTAEYLYEKLSKSMQGIAREMALVTSKGIVLPGWKRREKPGIEDLKRYLRRGLIKLIISTDVASEGLNLQVANVVVNYEPTWSPIKIEQRLGRVWRLGQEKEVTSYTIFLSSRIDRDVLEVLYKKLLAWGRSLHESRLSIGEEVVIDMMSEEGPTTIPLDAARGTPKYSEYKAIITYISGGKRGLERYVQSIISALASLKRSLERAGLTRSSFSRRTERLLRDVLGDLRGEPAERVLRELLSRAAELRGSRVKRVGTMISAGNILVEDNASGYYTGLRSLLPRPDDRPRPVYIVSSAKIEGIRELHLFRVTISFEGKPVYSETVGVGLGGSTRPIRGRKLLEILAEALSPSALESAAYEYMIPERSMKSLAAAASKPVLTRVARAATEEIINYVSKTEERSLSLPHSEWRPRSLGEFRDSVEYIGTIVFTTSQTVSPEGSPPPIRVKEVEDAAMRIAMDYERRMGRIPRDVSMEEHFDILSMDPRTGETRYIEVKGKSGLDLSIELTEAEFQLAKEKGGEYWLYIVYGIGTGEPRLLAVRDPANSMRWREVSVKRYRLSPE